MKIFDVIPQSCGNSTGVRKGHFKERNQRGRDGTIKTKANTQTKNTPYPWGCSSSILCLTAIKRTSNYTGSSGAAGMFLPWSTALSEGQALLQTQADPPRGANSSEWRVSGSSYLLDISLTSTRTKSKTSVQDDQVPFPFWPQLPLL